MAADHLDSAASTPLDVAVEAGDLQEVQFLLKQGEQITMSTRSRAAVRGYLDILQVLSGPQLDAHLSAREIAADRLFSVKHATRKGNLEVVKYLLNDERISEEELKGLHSASLREATFSNHASIVRYNIQNNADLYVLNERYENPLLVASRCGHFEVAKVLLDSGVETSEVAPSGRVDYNQLWRAAEGGHVSIMQLLLDHGADKERNSITTKDVALRVAADEGQLGAMDLLLQYGADIKHCRKQTLELLAQKKDDAEFLRLVEKYGLDVEHLGKKEEE